MQVYEPSVRDLEIYFAVCVRHEKQAVVAVEHKLSQPRVSRIVDQVYRWVAKHGPSDEVTPEQAAFVAAALQLEQTKHMTAVALEAFDKSCDPGRFRPCASIMRQAMLGTIRQYEASLILAKATAECVRANKEQDHQAVVKLLCGWPESEMPAMAAAVAEKGATAVPEKVSAAAPAAQSAPESAAPNRHKVEAKKVEPVVQKVEPVVQKVAPVAVAAPQSRRERHKERERKLRIKHARQERKDIREAIFDVTQGRPPLAAALR